MRKILGLCFAVMILACVFGVLGMPVFAETVITQLDVSGVTPAVVGEMPTTEGIVCNNENVSVTAYWLCYDYDIQAYNAHFEAFREGEIYQLNLQLHAAEGYSFDYEGINGYTVNGGSPDEAVYCWPTRANLNMYYFTGDVELIDTAQILSMPTLTPGQPTDVETFLQQIRIPEDANYEIGDVYVGDLDNNTVTGVMDDLYYRCRVYLRPKKGYWWDAKNVQIQVPEENRSSQYIQPDCVTINMVVDVRQVVQTLEVTFPDYQPGDATTLEGITVSGGVLNPELSHWSDGYYQPVQVIEEDNAYLLTLSIKTPKDHRYQEGVSQIQVNGLEFYDYYLNSSSATLYCALDLRLDTVYFLDVENVPEFVEPGPVPQEPLKLEHEGAFISQVQWLDEAGNPMTQLEIGKSYELEVTFQAKEGYKFQATRVRCNKQKEYTPIGDKQTIKITIPYTPFNIIKEMPIQVGEVVLGEKIVDLPVDSPEEKPYELRAFMDDLTDGTWGAEDVFEEGHSYRLILQFIAKEGYRFSREYEPLINGEKAESWAMTDDGTVAQVYLEYSFLYPVEKVELPAFPELKVGDALETTDAYPEGARYSYRSGWSVYTGESDSVAEDKGQYMFMYMVLPEKGYELTKDTVFTIDGVPQKPTMLYGSVAYVIKNYSFGYETIPKVELEVPIEIGAAIQDLRLPEDAPYRIERVTWGANESGDYTDPWQAIDTWQEGYYHYVELQVKVKDGYVLEYPLEVTVNGQTGMLISMTIEFEETTLVIGFGKLTDSIPGDADGDGDVDIDDAIYLLQHVLMPDQFPVEEEMDVDGSGAVTVDDAIYLLQHVLMPDQFPIA